MGPQVIAVPPGVTYTEAYKAVRVGTVVGVPREWVIGVLMGMPVAVVVDASPVITEPDAVAVSQDLTP